MILWCVWRSDGVGEQHRKALWVRPAISARNEAVARPLLTTITFVLFSLIRMFWQFSELMNLGDPGVGTGERTPIGGRVERHVYVYSSLESVPWAGSLSSSMTMVTIPEALVSITWPVEVREDLAEDMSERRTVLCFWAQPQNMKSINLSRFALTAHIRQWWLCPIFCATRGQCRSRANARVSRPMRAYAGRARPWSPCLGSVGDRDQSTAKQILCLTQDIAIKTCPIAHHKQVHKQRKSGLGQHLPSPHSTDSRLSVPSLH